MNGTDKLTVSYPIRISAALFLRLRKIADKKTWRMSDAFRHAIERGLKSLERSK
jgi:hypothetical protein